MLGAGNRERLMILGKGCHPDENGNRLTAEALRLDVEQSLEALQTDHMELYLLHRDDPEVPVGEVVDWLHEQRATGTIGAFGGSNWAVDRVRAANAYAAGRGYQRVRRDQQLLRTGDGEREDVAGGGADE